MRLLRLTLSDNFRQKMTNTILLPRKMGQQSLASLHWDSAYCSSYFWLEECPSRHLKTSNFEEKYRPASFQLFDLWLEFSVV